MKHFCDKYTPCLDDASFLNYSSEAVDTDIFIGFNRYQNQPRIGTSWTHDSCLGLCVSAKSQDEADLCALRNATLCVDGGGGTIVTPPCNTCPTDPGCPDGAPCGGDGSGCIRPECDRPIGPGGEPPLYGNEAQLCDVSCPDGTIFSYRVAADTFFNYSQTLANRMALTYACSHAAARRICLSELTSGCCANVVCNLAISATGGAEPITWSLISGTLPEGLVESNSTNGRILAIEGVAITPGNYPVTYRATDLTGSFMQKDYNISILGISTASPLPGYTAGVAYSKILTAAGGVGPYTFALATGDLPAGMVLSTDGEISGTSAATTDADFVVTVTDHNGQICRKSFRLPAIITPPFVCPSLKSQTNITSNSFGAIVLDSITGKLFYPNYASQALYRFNTFSNSEDGSIAGAFYPAMMLEISGINGVRHTLADFVVPSVGSNVDIQVDSTRLLSAGLDITINGKTYFVVLVIDDFDLRVKNLGDTPGNTVTTGAVIQSSLTLLLAAGDDNSLTTGQVHKIDPLSMTSELLFNLSLTVQTSNMVYASGSNKIFIPVGNGIDVIDVQSGSRVNIGFGSAIASLAYSASRNKVYVFKFNSDVDEMNASTLFVERTVHVSIGIGGSSLFLTPVCAVYSPVSDHIYVAGASTSVVPASMDNVVAVISAASFGVVNSITLSSDASGAAVRGVCLAYDPDADLIYASYTHSDTNSSTNGTQMIKTSTDTVVCSIPGVRFDGGVRVTAKSRMYGDQTGTPPVMNEAG